MTGENASSITGVNEIPANPRLILAIVSGIGAALVGAIIWAVITVTAKYQIGFMAIGVGFLVGYTIRTIGRGSTPPFGVAGALLALLGCVVGNVLSACGFISIQESMSIWEVLGRLNPQTAVDLVTSTFSGMDLVFYAIAVYEGYKLSLHKG